MGFFKKKSDPISERARALNAQIAALEAEIERLAARQNSTPEPEAKPSAPQPRLRSTALPHSRSGSTNAAPVLPPSHTVPPREPVFEDVNPFRSGDDAAAALPEQQNEIGVRKYDLPSVWERIKNNFRGPATSNPKLVNYLAAGSIQGLRPLRYEKRVARNRFLLFAIALALVLWGLVAVLLKR